MAGEDSKLYYDVALSLEATWKNNVYTYFSSEKLNTGAIVSVPFGNQVKHGYVVKELKTPKVKTKEVSRIYDFQLPKQTVMFIDWLNKNYPNMPGVHTQHLLPSGLDKWEQQETVDESLKLKQLPKLTDLQSKAVLALNKDNKSQVLHGITGSGKTRVYIELIKEQLELGRNVLLLYPEISLTKHMEQALKPFIGDNRVHTYHSKSTPKERRLSWIKAASGEVGNVFIGPRSALFLPINNLGLVIVDEAHDASYKQDSGSRYNGLLASAALAKSWKAKLIFGSATPPISETRLIEQNGGSIVCMHELAINSKSTLRKFSVVDMTEKNNISSVSYLFSKKLLDELNETLRNDLQSIVFLNRRGTSRSVVCQNCGWHAECTNCDNPLTYHHDNHQLICHVCGNKYKAHHTCPECSSELTQRTPGTKAVVEELNKMFPEAVIERFDSDNLKSESLSENYSRIHAGKIDILVGTQLLTKGLDLPRLETVGILQADSSLYLPDFSSTERTFQQLTQISGRVGRGHNNGKVILQTYNKNNSLFKTVMEQDWHDFYTKELKHRKDLYFPPFSFLARIWVSKKTSKSAQTAINKLAEVITDTKINILGPAPSFYEKNAGKYTWQLILRSNSRTSLIKIISSLPKDFYYDLDPVSLL